MKKRILILLTVFFLIIVLLIISVQIPTIQTFLVKRVSSSITKSINANIEIGSVSLDIFTNLVLNDVLVRDHNNDTLFFIQSITDNHSLLNNNGFGVDVSDIEISGVSVFLNNTVNDSTLNLIYAFRSKDNNVKKVKSKNSNKNEPPNIILKNISLNDIHFVYDDNFGYQRFDVTLDNLTIKSDSFSPFDSIMNWNSIQLNHPKCILTKKVSPNTLPDYTPKTLSIPFNSNISDFKLSKGLFILKDKNKNIIRRKGEILFSDLEARNINISAENVELYKRHIKGRVKTMNVIEKSGLAIRDLRTNLFFNSQTTIANNLYAKSNNSKIRGNLVFKYSNLKRYLRFAEWVNVSTDNLKGNLSLKDIEHFVPNLKEFAHLDIQFRTSGKGTMNGLKLKNLSAKINDAKINGDLDVNDMFRPKGLSFVFNSTHSEFDKDDAEFIFKDQYNSKEFTRLGKVNYKGTYKGDFKNFTLDGMFMTNYGSGVVKDLAIDITKPKKVKYKGNIQLNKFQLSKLFDLKYEIQNISLNTEVDGQGLELSELNTEVNGNLYSITLDGQFYNNISLNGIFKDKKYNGEIISTDKDLNFIAKGSIFSNDSVPVLDLNCKVKNLSLKKMNISDSNLYVKGDISLKGKGEYIDEFEGVLKGKNIFVYEQNSGLINIDKISDFNFSHYKSEGDHTYNIQSREVKGSVKGRVKLTEFPRIFKNYLIRYLTVGDIDASEKVNNDFKLDIELNDIKNYSKIFYPELRNIENGRIVSEYNHRSDLFKIDATLKNTYWNTFYVPNIRLSNKSSSTTFSLNTNIDSLFVNNVLGVTPIRIMSQQLSDGLKVTVELLERDDPKFVDVNTLIKKNSQNINFKILPFTSYYGRKTWNIDKDNSIVYDYIHGDLKINNLNLGKGEEQVRLFTENYKKNKLNIKLDKVKLEELISGFLPNFDILEGKLNGEVEIINIISKPRPVANLWLSDFKIKGTEICDFHFISKMQGTIINSEIEGYGGKLNFIANSVFDVEKDYLNSDIDLKYFDAALGKIILNDLVDELEGDISGVINLKGKLNNLLHSGSLDVNYMKVRPTVTKVRYFVKNQKVKVVPSKISIDNLVLNDQAGNKASATGSISHDKYKSFYLNVNASSDKLLCLNTDSKTNENFYGRVFAKADANFSGILGKIIKIKAKGQNLPLSKVNIAFSSQHQTEKYGFYNFVKKGESKDSFAKNHFKKSGVELDFNFDVNKDGRLSIIMDPDTKDRIDCKGEGKIVFHMSPDDEMLIKGTYEINSGTYLFTYQDVLQRTFYLNSGGKMTFIGDPYASLIDASATFKARANAQDIITAYYGQDNLAASSAKNTVKVNVILNLRGNIITPDINYKLNIDQNNPTLQSAFESIKTITENNENELNKQVMGIMLFRKFFPPSISGFQNTGVNGTDILNTFSGVVTDQLSSYITDWVQNTFKRTNVDLSFKNYSQFNSLDQSSDVRRELKLAFSQQLSDRLIFNFGGNYDFGRDQFQNTNTAFFGGDLDFEYLLNEDGRLRLRGYSTLDNDPLNSRYINKTGFGVIYLKNFNSMSSFFKSQKKNNE